MTGMPGWNDPKEDDRNPQRREERAHVREELVARLDEHSVWLSGDESDEEIVAMMNAVEAFEACVARLGGDSMVNTPESSDPDEERFVLPMRRDDESVSNYLDRLASATQELTEGGAGRGSP